MRVFITVSCFLAVASAGYYGGAPAQQHAPAPTGQYQGPLHIPVLDHNGVPVEPKEVQEARKSHLAALAAIPTSQDGGYDGQQYDQPQQYQQQQYQQQQPQQQQYNAPQQQYNAPQQQYNAPQQQYQPQQQQYQPQQQYRAPQHNQYQQQQQHQQQQPLPVIDAQGVPQDAPDVAAAKAAHFAAYAEANARTAPAPGPGAGQYGPAPQQPHWH